MHKPWLNDYIQLNINLRQQATTNFEKQMFKLFNNAVFGKTMENIRNHRNVIFCSSWKKAQKYIAKLQFKNFKIFNEGMVAVEMNNLRIEYNKPIYVGQTILDISKILMYDFHYEFIMEEFGKEFFVQLCYQDTDSLLYYFTKKDNNNKRTIYDLIRDNINYFDTSDYEIDNTHNLPVVNKKVMGKYMDECSNYIISRFISLRAKMYALEIHNADTLKKLKGIGNSAVKRLTFNDYYKVLCNKSNMLISYCNIRSINHSLYTVKLNKLALDGADDKRIIDVDNIRTKPYYHYSLL